jgi:hypothetical protein
MRYNSQSRLSTNISKKNEQGYWPLQTDHHQRRPPHRRRAVRRRTNGKEQPDLRSAHDHPPNLLRLPLRFLVPSAAGSHKHKLDRHGHRPRHAHRPWYPSNYAGFGLLFGYTRKLVWSGIGFNFFILAFCIVFYPLINDFWTKTQI